MAAQHVIELNGKRYDTATGKIIAGPSSHAAKTHLPKTMPHTPLQHKKQHKRPSNIDGFSRPASATHHAKETRAQTHHAKLARTTTHPNHIKRHTEKSHTLMRAPAKAQTIRSISADVTPATGFLTPSAPRVTIDPQRLKRAQSIPQNKFIGRFEAKSTPPAIMVEPTVTPTPQPAVAPEPIAPSLTTTIPTAIKPSTNQFEQAIAHATSHEQPKVKKPRVHQRVARKLHVKPRTVSAVSLIIITGTILGVVAYQNTPNIRMKIASNRSGISGTMPSYVPSGYSVGKNVWYKPGEISISFYSNTDGRKFMVTQAKSYWTSDLLRQEYVEPLKVDYQTIQENGKTIYLYGSSATWVDGGIWYRIESKDANLSSSQITNIIKSL